VNVGTEVAGAIAFTAAGLVAPFIL
jgi:hypothetical protein